MKHYCLEYTRAFDLLAEELSASVVTAYIGCHAIELGIEVLILRRGEAFSMVHKLGELSRAALSGVMESEPNLNWVVDFCERYSQYIEDGKVEYFCFLDYGSGCFFADNRLDIHWLAYNSALILLKLIHYAGLDEELCR